jgi:hypothetical protein
VLAVDEDAIIEDDDEAVADVEALPDVESSTAEVEGDLDVEFDVAASVETAATEEEDEAIVESRVVVDVELSTTEDEDDVIVEFEPIANTDTDTVVEDEDELVLELEIVSDAEEELEDVAEMALACRLPSVELLELYVESMLEELEIGWLNDEDELERILLEDLEVEIPRLLEDKVELPMLLEDVELLMLAEDDAKIERILLNELDEIVLDFDVLLLVEDAKLRLEDGVGEVDKIFGEELDRDELKEDEAEELPAFWLLLLTLEELLLILAELLLVVVELLLFLLDVLVLFVLDLILVSDALNELEVVAVTFFVSFLLAVNGFALCFVTCYLTYSVEVTVLDTVAVTTTFEGDVALMVLSTVFVEILRRDWQYGVATEGLRLLTTDWTLLIVQVLTARSWKSRGDPATMLAAAMGTRIFEARIVASHKPPSTF